MVSQRLTGSCFAKLKATAAGCMMCSSQWHRIIHSDHANLTFGGERKSLYSQLNPNKIESVWLKHFNLMHNACWKFPFQFFSHQMLSF